MRALSGSFSPGAARIGAPALLWLLSACIPGGGDAPATPPPPPTAAAAPQPDAEPVPSQRYDIDPPRPRVTPRQLRRAAPRPIARPNSLPTPRPAPSNAAVTALPAARPAWETGPVAPDAIDVTASTYRIRSGETLGRIADRTGAGVEAIARENGLVQPWLVRAGQQLRIPGGRFHLVRSGQSGIAIARAYAVPWSRIVAANALAEPFVLRAGQRVLIPGSPTAPASRAAERAAAFTLDVDTILTGGEPALASNQAPARPAATAGRVLPSTAVVAPPVRLTGGFGWPVDGRVVRRFGPGASGERNDGIKIAVPLSTPIHAAADGIVAYAGSGVAALGGLVIVKHGGGWTSIYGHAAKLVVQRGQSVRRGQTIAISGDTGFADRPEVHFELRRGRTPVDPQSQLPRS